MSLLSDDKRITTSVEGKFGDDTIAYTRRALSGRTYRYEPSQCSACPFKRYFGHNAGWGICHRDSPGNHLRALRNAYHPDRSHPSSSINYRDCIRFLPIPPVLTLYPILDT
jgi:hypothetical protein